MVRCVEVEVEVEVGRGRFSGRGPNPPTDQVRGLGVLRVGIQLARGTTWVARPPKESHLTVLLAGMKISHAARLALETGHQIRKVRASRGLGNVTLKGAVERQVSQPPDLGPQQGAFTGRACASCGACAEGDACASCSTSNAYAKWTSCNGGLPCRRQYQAPARQSCPR